MKIYCNPIDLPYALQFDGNTAFREAADPSLVPFGGKYYLFLSMNEGYFVTGDLVTYEKRPYPDGLPTGDYAPDVCVCGDELVFCIRHPAGGTAFVSSPDPERIPFTVHRSPVPYSDPCLFSDEDGRKYYYFGCSDREPIFGVPLDDGYQPLSDPVPLVFEDRKTKGYERSGDCHEDPRSRPWIEGAWMTKRDGRYYLQYAAPGTQFNCYCDAVATSLSPLGPFTPANNNPYSYEPGGFLTGAGHGSTFECPDGRFFHIATARVSVNHMFERRIGLWQAGFDRDGELWCDQYFGDYPRDTVREPFSAPPWMLLSYRKKITASSGPCPENAVDEDIRTSWRAGQDDVRPTLTLDLGSPYEVRAVSLSFADHREDLIRNGPAPAGGRRTDTVRRPLRWILEGSTDGVTYRLLSDGSGEEDCRPHPLVLTGEGTECRYLRLTVTQTPFGVPASVSGFRVFGIGHGAKPMRARLSGIRGSPIDAELRFAAENADGYAVRWGYAPDKLYHSETVYGRESTVLRALTAGQPLFVRVDSFNENGVTAGSITEIKETIQ